MVALDTRHETVQVATVITFAVDLFNANLHCSKLLLHVRYWRSEINSGFEPIIFEFTLYIHWNKLRGSSKNTIRLMA